MNWPPTFLGESFVWSLTAATGLFQATAVKQRLLTYWLDSADT